MLMNTSWVDGGAHPNCCYFSPGGYNPNFVEPEVCPLQLDTLNSCLQQNGASSACQACLRNARESFYEPQSTCTSVSNQCCVTLTKPSCPCPTKACGQELERYFGCFKKTIKTGCDDTLECCFDGCPPPFLGNLSRMFSAIIAALISMLTGG